jgi:hypothetical protein
MSDPEMLRRAASIAAAIEAENGVEDAVRFIEQRATEAAA